MKKQGRLKLKLTIMMVALTAIPLIFCIVYNYVHSFNTGEQHAYDMDKSEVKSVYVDFKTIIDQNFRTIEAMASSPSVQDFIDNPNDAALQEAIAGYIKAIDDYYGDGNPTIITGLDGMQIARSSGKLVDISDRDYFQQAVKTGKRYTSDIIVSKSNGSRIIINIVPIIRDGQVIGTVQRNYDLSVLHQLMESEVREEKEEVLMVDNTGSVIAHSAREISADEPEDQSMNPFYTESRNALDAEGIYEAPWMGVMWQIAYQRDPDTGFVVVVARDKSVALRTVKSSARGTILIGVILLILATVIVLLVAGNFIKPIISLVDSVKHLADKKFNEPDIPVKSKDELGVMSESFNSMKHTLKGVLNETKTSVNYVSDSAEQFTTVAEQSALALSSIAKSTTELADNASAQGEVVEAAVNETREMSESINQVINNMNDIKEESINTTRQAEDGTEKIADAVAFINILKEEMEKTQETMVELEQQSQSITEITDTISDIASQTNLLSLNASIEAARAGEAGRGFAVVATEVGNLAAESQKASEQISVIIENIQQSTNNVARAMKNSLEKTLQSAEAVDKAGAAFTGIAKNIETLNIKIAESSKVSDEVLTKNDEVQEAIRKVEKYAKEISAGTENISAATEQQTASMQEVAASSHRMNELSATLKEQIEDFDI